MVLGIKFVGFLFEINLTGFFVFDAVEQAQREGGCFRSSFERPVNRTQSRSSSATSNLRSRNSDHRLRAIERNARTMKTAVIGRLKKIKNEP